MGERGGGRYISHIWRERKSNKIASIVIHIIFIYFLSYFIYKIKSLLVMVATNGHDYNVMFWINGRWILELSFSKVRGKYFINYNFRALLALRCSYCPGLLLANFAQKWFCYAFQCLACQKVGGLA